MARESETSEKRQEGFAWWMGHLQGQNVQLPARAERCKEAEAEAKARGGPELEAEAET